MRTLLRWMLAGIAAALVAAPAVAQTETVVVDNSLFDSFTSGGNPGCGGCGLLDWDDTHNNGWGCRRLPSGGRGALCGGENNPPDPDWDDATALHGSIGIQSVLPRRLDGLVTEFNDGPMDPDPDSFPPWDPSVSGAVQSLTGTYAFRHTGSNEISTTIRGHLLIKQDGDFYLSDHSVPASTGSGGSLGSWVEVGKNGSGDLVVFTADDFDLSCPTKAWTAVCTRTSRSRERLSSSASPST